MDNSQKIYRFAPSPTGQMHIGNLRSAIFNWLLARSQGSKFYLRIEDTDLARSTKEASEGIFRSLKWIGINWDNEVIYQSQRFEIYKKWAQNLIEAGLAYFCQCTTEDMDALREQSSGQGSNFKYPGTCRNKGIKEGFGSLPLRFLVKQEELGEHLEFVDLIKGPIKTASQFLDDIVLFRSDGTPTYNFCVVVDDHFMGVTDVIRGEDHICNTPKQILLYKAFGLNIPQFGHLPMVLDQHGAKLSKRSGTETSVDVYRTEGFLPEALLNYLVRLGWSHGDQEIFTREELFKLFSLDHVGRKGAAFDIKKLQWLNGVHIKKLDVPRALELLELMGRENFSSVYQIDPSLFSKALALYLPKALDLCSLLQDLAMFVSMERKAQETDFPEFYGSKTATLVSKFTARALALDPFEEASLLGLAKEFCATEGSPMVDLAQGLRVALTGKKVSPSVFGLTHVLGKEKFKSRVDKFLLQYSKSATK